MKTRLLLAILAVGYLLDAAAAPWAQFRGPNGAGIAGDARPPIRFGPDTNLLWKTALPPGHSSPILWADRIFLTAFDGEIKKLETLCLDRRTGRIRWRRAAPTEKIEKVNRINNPAASTPTTDGQTVFVYFGSFGLIAYDFEGGVRWQKPLPVAKTRFGHGTGTSPILAGDRLLLDVHLDKESHLLAVRCRDGETLWKSAEPLFNDGWSTPLVWSEADAELVGVLNAGKFTAHDLQTGVERWWVHRLPNQICATPVVGDGVLYLTGTGVFGERHELIPPPNFEELVTRFDANKDGRIGTDEIPEDLLLVNRQGSQGEGNIGLRESLLWGSEAKNKSYSRQEWEKEMRGYDEFVRGDMMKSAICAVRTGGTGDVTESHRAWLEPKGVPEVPSPLLYRGRLYGVKNGGLFLCRDAANGRMLFEERLGAPGGYFASPVAADGRIYFASDRGVITVAEAADRFRILAQADLGEPIMATPALVDDQLYVRSADHVWAFGKAQSDR
ncbi:MAG: PQQ-binding-like beta-propeller repeat protein [Verrucomicrobiales bacterium]|nr:PQQ-binding-like beta-propeller repeat protein [Verrucomicrobiales bacterium]